MDSKQLINSKPVLQTENRSVPVKLESVEDDGYCIRFVLEREVDPGYEPVLALSSWPSGMNGMMMTSWASALGVVVEK